MKLGKLLGVGKSFFGSDPTAAYRVNKRACLPRFNDGKNPFAPKMNESAAEKPSSQAAAAPVIPAAAKTESSAVRGVSSGLTVAQAVAAAGQVRAKTAEKPYAFKPAAKPVFKPVAKPVATPAAEAAKPAAKPARTGWTTRLNPFRPPEPEVKPVAVQAELSLDAVKVVHNDLSDVDVDVEVVPLKSHAAPAVQPSAPVLPPARQAWEYLGESLLKSS